MDLRFVWQAWHLVTSTFVLCDKRGIYGTGLGLVTRLVALGAAAFCVAGVALGVALGDMDLRFVRGTYGTGLGLVTRLVALGAAAFCVAGVALGDMDIRVALGDMDLRFVWQAWHLVTWTFVLCDRRGTYGTGLGLVTRLVALGRGVLRGRRGTWRGTYGTGLGLVTRLVALGAAAFCVAGVALGEMDLRFVWQAWHLAWHLVTSTFVLCGRRGTYGTQLGLVTRVVALCAAAFCVAGVALGDMDLRFVWQAWHLVTWTFVLCDKRGTYGTGLGLVTRLVALGAAAFCVAGVALGDMDLRFVWQAWHLVTWTFVLCGRRGTYGTGLGLVTRVALGDIDLRFVWQARHFWHWAGPCDALGRFGRRFVWQAWHLVTSTSTLCGRRGTYGTQLALVTRLRQARHLATWTFTLCGICGPW
eukprot:s1802_g18.t1